MIILKLNKILSRVVIGYIDKGCTFVGKCTLLANCVI